jgi:hypothetical protein
MAKEKEFLSSARENSEYLTEAEFFFSIDGTF